MNAVVPFEKVARYFQRDAADITYKMMCADILCRPIMALPTGSGKSHTFALLIDLVLSDDPRNNILILCDRAAILKQDHEELEEYFGIDIGLYSSDLDSFTIEKITVAGIQSIFRKPHLFKQFTWIIIDECDSVNDKDMSMYRKFIDGINKYNNENEKPEVRALGATATPYGLKAGYLHEGKNAFFNCISIDYTRGEKYLKLVEEGYIADIIPFPTSVKLDPTGLKKLGGDFSTKAQSEKFDIESITRAAMIETAYCGKNFKRWIIFAIDIKHANNIGRILTEMGISNCVVHSKMEGDKHEVLERSKKGEFRAIINVDILTIGYNDPKVDLAVLMYCTMSPRKHVQAPGRLRPDPEVPVKVVLDFGGNFSRMGPLNDVKIKSIKDDKKEKSGPMMKSCPECKALNHLSAKFCKNCEFEFISEVKLKNEADKDVVMIKKDFKAIAEQNKKEGLKGWASVSSIKYSRRSKPGMPDGVLVEYKCGFITYKDFVNIEHSGYPQYIAKNWIKQRWTKDDMNPPQNVDMFLKYQNFLKTPSEILVDKSGKYPKIVDVRFE